jgi:hypothetical protein
MLIIIIYIDFSSVLPEVLQDITDADYVAIDRESTVILPFDKMGYFDIPVEQYKQHYEVYFSYSYLRNYIIYFSLVDII